jgi:transcriptional regulator with XRE-family HTH domain
MEKNVGKTIADNIRAERNRMNMTQEQVSKKLGITKRTYIKYEEDASKVSSSTLADLSEMFNCDIKCFFINL